MFCKWSNLWSSNCHSSFKKHHGASKSAIECQQAQKSAKMHRRASKSAKERNTAKRRRICQMLEQRHSCAKWTIFFVFWLMHIITFIVLKFTRKNFLFSFSESIIIIQHMDLHHHRHQNTISTMKLQFYWSHCCEHCCCEAILQGRSQPFGNEMIRTIIVCNKRALGITRRDNGLFLRAETSRQQIKKSMPKS